MMGTYRATKLREHDILLVDAYETAGDARIIVRKASEFRQQFK